MVMPQCHRWHTLRASAPGSIAHPAQVMACMLEQRFVTEVSRNRQYRQEHSADGSTQNSIKWVHTLLDSGSCCRWASACAGAHAVAVAQPPRRRTQGSVPDQQTRMTPCAHFDGRDGPTSCS
jgi:hypothetical protein